MWISVAITFLVLMSGMGLFVVARERQRNARVRKLRAAHGHPAALGPAEISDELAEILDAGHELRLVLAAALVHGAQVELLHEQLTQYARSPRRRPLWLRVEDSNYEYDLDLARRATQQWLDAVDRLPPHPRARLFELGLDTSILAALATVPDSIDRDDLARAVEDALTSMEAFERSLASTSGGIYR